MANGKNKKAMDKEITDSLLDDFDKFEHFVMNHWRHIISAAIVIVVVAIIAAVSYSVSVSRENKMNNAIANAQTVEELQQVIGEYPRGKAVIYAYTTLAHKFINNKNFKAADDTYAALLKIEIPQDMKWQITIDRAYIKELSGDIPGAIKDFAAISKDAMLPRAMRAEANYSAGRLEVKEGNKDQAMVYLNLASSLDDNQSPGVAFWAKQAKSLIQTLTPKTAVTADKK